MSEQTEQLTASLSAVNTSLDLVATENSSNDQKLSVLLEQMKLKDEQIGLDAQSKRLARDDLELLAQ